MDRETFLIECADDVGLLATMSSAISAHGQNITEVREHAENGHYAVRFEIDCQDSSITTRIHENLTALAAERDGRVRRLADHRPRIAVLFSREAHCAHDLAFRIADAEIPADLSALISNHPHPSLTFPDGRTAEHLAHTSADKPAGEQRLLETLRPVQPDLIILARYMQILSGKFLDRVGCDVINVHHSLLPAFIGANTYERAWARGVKSVGATAHYVTEDLDEGPIIAQRAESVTHSHDPDRLRRLGRDLERTVLADAVLAHVELRAVRMGGRVVVFD